MIFSMVKKSQLKLNSRYTRFLLGNLKCYLLDVNVAQQIIIVIVNITVSVMINVIVCMAVLVGRTFFFKYVVPGFPSMMVLGLVVFLLCELVTVFVFDI